MSDTNKFRERHLGPSVPNTPEPPCTKRDVAARITDYLTGGGLFNPEMANPDAVRDLLIDARAELAAVRAEMCGLCQHPLEDNAHGPDQNDFEMNGDKLKHFGTCTYCKYCNGAAQSAAVAAVRAESKQREKEAYKRGWNRGFKALLLRLP